MKSFQDQFSLFHTSMGLSSISPVFVMWAIYEFFISRDVTLGLTFLALFLTTNILFAMVLFRQISKGPEFDFNTGIVRPIYDRAVFYFLFLGVSSIIPFRFPYFYAETWSFILFLTWFVLIVFDLHYLNIVFALLGRTVSFGYTHDSSMPYWIILKSVVPPSGRRIVVRRLSRFVYYEI